VSGRAPRQKGNRTERAVVQALKDAGIAAKRVPLSGSVVGYPGDVRATVGGRELTLEVKARRDFRTLHSWLEGRDALILKADRRAPLLVIRLNDALNIMRFNGAECESCKKT
jgi:hypothetical protein